MFVFFNEFRRIIMKKYLKFLIPFFILAIIMVFSITVFLKRNKAVEIPFKLYEGIAQVEDNKNARKLSKDILNSSIYKEEKLDLFKELLFTKYPNSNAALDARIWIAQIDIDRVQFMDYPLHAYRQAWFIKYKEMLPHHENSIKLLFNLASNGYDTFPEESANYADKAIALDPKNSDLYLVSSKAYQMMGDYTTALHRLEKCRDILLDRLLSELKKDIPYEYEQTKSKLREVEADHFVDHRDIDFARSYLTGMGYDLGKISNNHKEADTSDKISVESEVQEPDPDDPPDLTYTNIKDLEDLQRVIYFITRIKEKNPIWYPDRKLSIPQDLKSILKADR